MMRVAVTGPSETLSYHPSLSAKDSTVELNGDPDFPGPPTTTSRPFASVRSVARLMSLTIALGRSLRERDRTGQR